MGLDTNTGNKDFGSAYSRTQATETGSVTSLFMLLSITMILIAEKSWNTFFGEFPIISQLMIAVLIFCFVLYSLLIGIYTVLSGEPSCKQLRKMVMKESKKLDSLVQEASKAVEELESQLRVVSGIMHPQGFVELRKLKAMLVSLEARSKKAKNLIKSKDEDKIVAGYNIFFSNIGDFEDAYNCLILDDNLPECPYESIPQELRKRIEFVEKTLPVKSSLAI
jgi:hypothetical protein